MVTKAEIKAVGDKVRTAVKDALEGTGYELVKSNGTYGENDFTMTLRMFKGDGKTKGQTDWEKYAPLDGLPEDGFGKLVGLKFKGGPKTYKIVGYKPGSPKFSVTIEETKTGKVSSTTNAVIGKALKEQHGLEGRGFETDTFPPLKAAKLGVCPVCHVANKGHERGCIHNPTKS